MSIHKQIVYMFVDKTVHICLYSFIHSCDRSYQNILIIEFEETIIYVPLSFPTVIPNKMKEICVEIHLAKIWNWSKYTAKLVPQPIQWSIISLYEWNNINIRKYLQKMLHVSLQRARAQLKIMFWLQGMKSQVKPAFSRAESSRSYYFNFINVSNATYSLKNIPHTF